MLFSTEDSDDKKISVLNGLFMSEPGMCHALRTAMRLELQGSGVDEIQAKAAEDVRAGEEQEEIKEAPL